MRTTIALVARVTRGRAAERPSGRAAQTHVDVSPTVSILGYKVYHTGVWAASHQRLGGDRSIGAAGLRSQQSVASDWQRSCLAIRRALFRVQRA